jgi:hypothetical protein
MTLFTIKLAVVMGRAQADPEGRARAFGFKAGIHKGAYEILTIVWLGGALFQGCSGLSK